MKFIIKLILITLTLILITNESQGQHDVRKYRLSRVLENIIMKINIRHEIGAELDVDCTKNFLNLPQNNNMIVKEAEELIILVGAAIKCSNAEDEVFESIFNKFVHDTWQKQLSCMKWHLQQLEPTSTLIKNFVISETDMKKCQDDFRLIKDLKGFQREVEGMVGPVDVLTCGAVSTNSANDFLKFISKGAIIEYDDISNELRKTEREKLKEYFKDLTLKTIDCIIKRYEADPKAYHIDDTLNFFYKNNLVPIESDHGDPNDYYKRLAKVEGTIDTDCVKEKLNLQQNGEIALLEVEATILIASAKSKCIKIDPLGFSDLFIDFALEQGQRHPRYYSCAKYKLQKLEPSSKLAITTSINEPHEKYCRHYHIEIRSFSIWIYTDMVGRLNETTCGVLTKDIVDVITLKTMLLFDEKDKDLKINETKELFKYAIDKLQKLADCILVRNK